MARCLTIICLSLALATPLFAKTKKIASLENSLSISIKWNNTSDEIDFSLENQKEFLKGCKLLGKSLKVGQGAFGSGIFSKFYCSTKKKSKASDFELEMKTENEQLVFTMKYLAKGLVDHDLFELKSPYYADNIRFLKDKEVATILAYAISNAMPAFGGIDGGELKSTGKITGKYPKGSKGKPFKIDSPAAPEELILYRLRFNTSSSSWQSVVVGRAKLVKGDAKTKNVATWEVAKELLGELPEKRIWFHSSQGLRHDQEELWSKLEESIDPYAENTLAMRIKQAFGASIVGGYMGLRYGKQIFTGSDLLEQASLLGLLVELRGGPLKGLRYYYDLSPEVKQAEVDINGVEQETSFGWSRHTLGVSFGLDFDFFISRIDIIPKIGIWNFEAVLPNSQTADGVLEDKANFKMKDTTSLAIEVGVESHGESTLLRGWAAADMGVGVKKGETEVTSKRAGIDIYYLDGPEFSILSANFHTTILGFFVFESLSLVSEESSLDSTYGYLGLGTAISW